MDAKKLTPKETVSASKKLGRKDAAELVRSASKIIVATGKKRSDFKGGSASKDIVDAMLGPTGNLRAPALRAGRTVIVGFNDEVYGEVLA